MKLARDSWLAIILLLVLLAVTVGAGYQQNKNRTIPYLATSAAPDGMLVLNLWFEKLGYRIIEDSPSSAYQPPKDTDLIFIVQPLYAIEDRAWGLLDEWIEAGGTLFYAADNFNAIYGFDHFDFSRQFLEKTTDPLAAPSPLLVSPPLLDPAPVRADFALTSTRTDFTSFLVTEGQPVVVTFKMGNGRVILSSTPYLFSNRGLKEKGNAALMLNLLTLAEYRGRVWFDDWHHGIQTTAIVGPSQWLRRTPAGHALLFTFIVIFLALLLQGSNFGRPIPLQHEIKRRGPMEHVTAIANLNRKAGHRADVLRQYHHRVKRHLGGRYRLDPSLPDAEYVEQLAKYNPALEKEKLLALLQNLSRNNYSEAEMVKFAEEASKWINE